MTTHALPKLITFDGEARSGKGTIVQATKDYLRDTCGYKVMLIDAGQVFRVLVVAAAKDGVNLDDPVAIDAFLGSETKAEMATQLVKEVYHMSKDERDGLLYTNDVGVNSAKIGARPLSQDFKDSLLKKWLRDAQLEGYEVVLLDGRALEETGNMLERAGLCEFVLGLYFVCDPVVGARRTLGFAGASYEELSIEDRTTVDELVAQINERNTKDRTRTVQPIKPPLGVDAVLLPREITAGQKLYLVDTSASMTKQAMALPVAHLAERTLAAL